MKPFSKSFAAAALTSVIALSGCSALTPGNAEASRPSTQAATVEEVVVPYEDFTSPNPMGFDIAGLVAESPTAITYYFSPEEAASAATFGLNWVEKLSAVPSLFDKNRNPKVDDNIALKSFVEVIRQPYRDETVAKMADHGAPRHFLSVDTDGRIVVESPAAGDVRLEPTIEKVPTAVEWSGFGIEPVNLKDGALAARITGTGKYDAVGMDGAAKSMLVKHTVTVARSVEDPSRWSVSGWAWEYTG